MVKICLLGGTGSLGQETLDVIRSYPDLFYLQAFSFHSNLTSALKIIAEFHPATVIATADDNFQLLKKMNLGLSVINQKGLESLMESSAKDLVLVNCTAGLSSLVPTLNALKAGRKVLLANKECLVVAGEIIQKLLKKYHSELIPLDSEHSALFQILDGKNKDEIERLVLTASGGALRDVADLTDVKVEDVLMHPVWPMGKRITVDSATMANKGLEVIEAHYLFDIPYDKISAVLQRESIVHALVVFKDNHVLAHMATPDMRLFIQYALTYPKRLPFKLAPIPDINNNLVLHFEKIAKDKYPLLDLAYRAGIKGGIMPAVYNASDSEAVSLFLAGKIKFLDIYKIVDREMRRFQNISSPTLKDILDVDRKVRIDVRSDYKMRI